MDNLRLTKKVFNWSSNVQVNNCKNWVFNVKKFLNVNNLNIVSDDCYTSKDAVELCKPVFQQLECVKWRSNLWNDHNNVNGNKLIKNI